jgi:acyl-CoA reductase-like NAD-dependent aldehyde dehydrogenase
MIPWPEPTTLADCDQALDDLRAHAPSWVALELEERIRLLDEVADNVVDAAEEWVEISCRAKGIELGSNVESEEWLAGPWTVLRHIKLQARTLRDIEAHGSPRLPGRARVNDKGRVVAPVFPTDPLDKILFRGITAEVWMEPDVALEDLEKTMGWMHRTARSQPMPTVSLVLGAGNVSSIAPLDALFELFARGSVVALKSNPINSYLGPVWERVFRPVIEIGAMRILHGGASTGDYMCHHHGVDRVHITGSDRTYDAIVWGTGEEGERRKESGEKRIDLPISAELGNVSPIIVVPGPWSQSDIRFHASNAASSLVNNAGFNCLATRTLVTSEAWPKRRALLDAIGESLKNAPSRTAYYPGALERHGEFLRAHPDASQFGAEAPGRVPWTLVEGVDPRQHDDVCFQTESWCGLMAETALPGDGAAEFLREAVEFCNDVLWGTLNATLLVHPKSMADPETARAVNDAIARLRYGAVSVNIWAGATFAVGSTPWGAFPGHTPEDIRSGVGFVHNTYLFERGEKAVTRAPFRIWPRPAWFHDTKRSTGTARRLFDVTANTTPWRLARTLWSAIRG